MPNHENRSPKATQSQALADQLQASGFQVKLWRGERIYLQNLGLDADVIIQFDNPARPAAACTSPIGLFQGCSLKVFSNMQHDSPAESMDRAKFVKHGILTRLAGAGIIPGPIALRWQDISL